ncbi:MAG TPA: OstA-like protein [Bacteroidales bacterium]|nr:OstA-like protein [Bacteroidales bacterium]
MSQKASFNILWHKGLITSLFCLFSLMAVGQTHGKKTPVPTSKEVYSAPAKIEMHIPNMTRNAAKKQAAATSKPVTNKNVSQIPMTQKYIQSGLMRIPLMNVPVKKKRTGKKIKLEYADVMSFDAFLHPDYQLLTGSVRFRHEGAELFCDSAHYFQKTNSLYAYGNVHMEQGDTLFLYGAWLYYDGTNKLAQVREKVRLENRNVTLFTDSLNFDRSSNVGYFFDGGLLVDEKNELSSEYGQYSPDTKIANFRNDVKLVHPKFVMTNKELTYNTNTKIADIHVPTDIVSDSGYVYTTKGNYNTSTDKSVLYNRSYVISDHRRLTGDTVFYDQKNSIGEAFGNVVLIDTVQQITMIGGYGYSEEKTGLGLMARSPLLIEHSEQDTLWLHADTLMTQQDSIYKSIKAFHGVRFFRNDFQGLCDSMYYSTRDSILSFYQNPVLWSAEQQISGDFIQMHTKNNKPEMLHIQRAAMLISFEGDSLYDQSSGKDLKAYFDSSQVVKVEIRGNAETVYLPRDKEDQIMGLNRLEGSSLDLYRHDEKVKKVVVWPEPKGKFYPLNMLDPEARFLQNFAWYSEARPTSPEDIFRVYKIQDKSTLKKRTPPAERK